MKTSRDARGAMFGSEGRDESTPLLRNRRGDAAWAMTVSLLVAALVGASMLTLAYALTTNATSVEDHVKAQLGGWTMFRTTTSSSAAVAADATRP